MAREIELKLEVGAAAAERLPDHPLLAGSEAGRQNQLSVYFDTKKNKLRTAGYTLRVRDTGAGFVQTIKAGSGNAGLFDRDEWEAPVAGLWPDALALVGTPLAQLLTPQAVRKLIPLVRSDVERTTWLIDQDGSRLELILDRGLIKGGTAEQPLHEIEIELKQGEADAIVGLARQLAQTVPLRIGVLTKAERGFALADGLLAKVAKAGPVHVDENMSAAQGFTAIFHACLRHFRLNEPLVVSTRDPGALHQARVAMRRLRAAFSLFRPILRDDRYEPLREELRWFTPQLGEARNLDVFLGQLDQDHPDRPRLAGDREQAYTTIIETLASQRFRDLMLDLLAWVELGPWRGSKKARRPLAQIAVARIDRLWEKIEPAAATLRDLPEEPRHRLRIDIKKLRYALEFVAGLHRSAGPSRKRFMTALEGLQEELGYLNDMATARGISASLAGAQEPSAGATAPSEPEAEAAHVANAEASFRRLRKAGPFWRALPPSPA